MKMDIWRVRSWIYHQCLCNHKNLRVGGLNVLAKIEGSKDLLREENVIEGRIENFQEKRRLLLE